MVEKSEKSRAKKGKKKSEKSEAQGPPVPEGPPPYDRPFGYYYPPMIPAQPPTPSKESNRMIMGIVAVVVIIIILIIIGFFGFLYSITTYEPDDETIDYYSEVIITDGGHFRYSLDEGWYEEMEVKMDISSKDGKYFDVYIMDEDQYQNTYENQTVLSFASFYSMENITSVKDTVDLPARATDFYLVIDNRDTAITLNDASPDGTITLEMDLEVTIKYTYWD
ncbi:hypothetical protein [[Eubacterium] cellulosolvens]